MNEAIEEGKGSEVTGPRSPSSLEAKSRSADAEARAHAPHGREGHWFVYMPSQRLLGIPSPSFQKETC